METKKTIRKVFFTAIWLTIGTGMVILLAAAIGKKNKERCSGYKVTVKAAGDQAFVDKKDVIQLLVKATHGKIKGVPVSSLDLRELSTRLENNAWVQKAQLYFDNSNVLNITVTEREPIARIFTSGNRSFYIDEDLKKMPLSERIVAKLPVFTNYPEKLSASRDSILLTSVKNISEFILNNSFWKSQIAQIDLDPDNGFEMVPVVGYHTVLLGDGDNISKKFDRLMIFYKEVLSKTGLNRFTSIDVRFSGQVVAVKGKALTKVDSVQLRKNVEKLLLQAQQLQSDTAFTTGQSYEKPVTTKDSLEDNERNENSTTANGRDPVTGKSSLRSKPSEKNKKAKAVMPKKN